MGECWGQSTALLLLELLPPLGHPSFLFKAMVSVDREPGKYPLLGAEFSSIAEVLDGPEE